MPIVEDLVAQVNNIFLTVEKSAQVLEELYERVNALDLAAGGAAPKTPPARRARKADALEPELPEGLVLTQISVAPPATPAGPSTNAAPLGEAMATEMIKSRLDALAATTGIARDVIGTFSGEYCASRGLTKANITIDDANAMVQHCTGAAYELAAQSAASTGGF